MRKTLATIMIMFGMVGVLVCTVMIFVEGWIAVGGVIFYGLMTYGGIRLEKRAEKLAGSEHKPWIYFLFGGLLTLLLVIPIINEEQYPALFMVIPLGLKLLFESYKRFRE